MLYNAGKLVKLSIYAVMTLINGSRQKIAVGKFLLYVVTLAAVLSELQKKGGVVT